MKFQFLFSRKTKKNIISLLSAKFAHCLVSAGTGIEHGYIFSLIGFTYHLGHHSVSQHSSAEGFCLGPQIFYNSHSPY